MDLTILNSTFQNIAYEEGFLRAVNQGIALKGVTFTNIKLPPFVQECFFDPEFCQGLFHCFGESRCSLHNVCVQNVDCCGNVAILGMSNRTDWNVTGSLSVKGLNLNVQEFKEFQGGACETGIGRYEDREHTKLNCISEDDMDAVATNECPLGGGI